MDAIRSFWHRIRPRLAVAMDEVFDDLVESDLFEMMIEWGRTTVRSLWDSDAPNENKRKMLEDQIESEAKRLGKNVRSHAVQLAASMAYRSILKEKGLASLVKPEPASGDAPTATA